MTLFEAGGASIPDERDDAMALAIDLIDLGKRLDYARYMRKTYKMDALADARLSNLLEAIEDTVACLCDCYEIDQDENDDVIFERKPGWKPFWEKPK